MAHGVIGGSVGSSGGSVASFLPLSCTFAITLSCLFKSYRAYKIYQSFAVTFHMSHHHARQKWAVQLRRPIATLPHASACWAEAQGALFRVLGFRGKVLGLGFERRGCRIRPTYHIQVLSRSSAVHRLILKGQCGPPQNQNPKGSG